MKTILVTGVDGQLGFELCRVLAGEARVVPTSVDPAAFPGICPAGTIRLDLTDEDAIRRVAREARPDVIINPAAYTAVDKAEDDAAMAARVNATAPGVLAEEARRLGAAMIHYSTDYVFDGSGERPWREDDPTGPLGVYGATKRDGERAVIQSGARALVFRTSWVYGAHGANFVKTMLRLGRERESLAVVGDQVGAPTSARELARATARVMASLRDGADEDRWGTYHMTCGGAVSWHGFAEEIFRLAREAGVPLRVGTVRAIRTEEYPTRAARPRNSRMDGSSLARRFDTRLADWREALAEMMPEILAAR